MGARLESGIVIKRPVQEVFAYVLDLQESFRAFDPDVESVDKEPDGPIAAGTTFRLWQTVLGRRISALVRYTAVDPDRRIEFVALAGPLATAAVLSFEANDRGTFVRFRGDARPTGPLGVLGPVVKAVIGSVWRKRLRRLKGDLESRTGKTDANAGGVDSQVPRG